MAWIIRLMLLKKLWDFIRSNNRRTNSGRFYPLSRSKWVVRGMMYSLRVVRWLRVIDFSRTDRAPDFPVREIVGGSL